MKKYKKPFFLIVMPLLIVLYFIAFQKYHFSFESHPVNKSTYTQILDKYEVDYHLSKKDSCNPSKSDKAEYDKIRCDYTYKATLPKFIYFKFYFYTIN